MTWEERENTHQPTNTNKAQHNRGEGWGEGVLWVRHDIRHTYNLQLITWDELERDHDERYMSPCMRQMSMCSTVTLASLTRS